MNQKGFFNISLIIVIPFLFSILFSSFWVLWFLKINLEAQSICQKYVLKAQEKLVSANNHVMSLNPRALTLHSEKKRLKHIIANGTPKAKAAAATRLAMIIKQQKVLLQVQESFFLTGNYSSKHHLFLLKSKWLAFQNNIAVFLKEKLFIKYPINIEFVSSQLSVAIDDIAPIYKRSSTHWVEQQIRGDWVIPFSQFFPKWIKEIVPIHNHWEGSCASHPHKGGFKWSAAIGEGKH